MPVIKKRRAEKLSRGKARTAAKAVKLGATKKTPSKAWKKGGAKWSHVLGSFGVTLAPR